MAESQIDKQNPIIAESKRFGTRVITNYTLSEFLKFRGEDIDLATDMEKRSFGPDERHTLSWNTVAWMDCDFTNQYGLNDTAIEASKSLVLYEWLLSEDDVEDPIHTPPEILKKILISEAKKNPTKIRERFRDYHELVEDQISPFPQYGLWIE